jgi:nucleoside 2-deoxyribosyltransferase
MQNIPANVPLLIGEVFVDFTLATAAADSKLRLGGIVHAARAFWALDVPFRVGAILPAYLEETVRVYLESLGCVAFEVFGDVLGAPNVTIIGDQREVGDQQYETLLREEHKVELRAFDLANSGCKQALVFPGGYDLAAVCAKLPIDVQLHLDVAYDLKEPALLGALLRNVSTVFISTSSPLFLSLYDGNLENFAATFQPYINGSFILKENRGGSRLVSEDGLVENLPAQLGTTVNSVGVGDAFAATYVAMLFHGTLEAAWRALYVATAYSQTTYPDRFRENVQRDLQLSLDEMKNLGGVSLPWERRKQLSIYLAAPDFSYGDRRAIDAALAALGYHNFNVRRPIQENGELELNSEPGALARVFHSDCELLSQCELLFAVPTGRDPGTLVEIGLAIERGIPVVVYDPSRENANTMVMAGSNLYSEDLDACLNAVFSALSRR